MLLFPIAFVVPGTFFFIYEGDFDFLVSMLLLFAEAFLGGSTTFLSTSSFFMIFLMESSLCDSEDLWTTLESVTTLWLFEFIIERSLVGVHI